MKAKYYAIKSAIWRKAGTVQKRCLIIQLRGTSFHSAGKIDKLAVPGKVIVHVGMSKRGHWVFLWKGTLWIRYPSYELSGNETKWKRNAEARENAKACALARQAPIRGGGGAATHAYHRNNQCAIRNGRVIGSVHLWGGDSPWGNNGKFALKPFEGEMRITK